MTRERVSNLNFGYCEDVPVVVALALTDQEQRVAEQALLAVQAPEKIGRIANTGLVKAEGSPWIAVQADHDLTPQEAVDKLGKYGSVVYRDGISRQDIIQTMGVDATAALLGRRPGVL